jgi:hypothetical protein
MKRLIEVILTMLGTAAFALFLAMMLLEWAAGCGETYIDAKGERHAHECMFIGKLVKEWFK